MNYRVLVEVDEDGVFVAEVPSLPVAFLRALHETKHLPTSERPFPYTLKVSRSEASRCRRQSVNFARSFSGLQKRSKSIVYSLVRGKCFRNVWVE